MKNGIVKIGRSNANDLIIDDQSISGEHATITIKEDGTMILCDHSTNGTAVNGELLLGSSRQILYGDSIMFPNGGILDWGGLMEMINNARTSNVTTTPDGGRYVAPEINGNDSLSFGTTIKEAMGNGVRNALSMAAIFFLAVFTMWIPYFGFGVMIALAALPTKYADGEVINPFYIFSSEYRKHMSDYVLLQFMMLVGIVVATLFGSVMGIVLSLGWSLAVLFVINRGMSPLAAMQASYKATYGSKWTILGVNIVLSLILALYVGLVGLIFASGEIALTIIGGVLILVGIIVWLSITIAATGSIWKQLNGNV